MLDFELAHAAKQDVERDPEEFVSDNRVWVGFVRFIKEGREEGTFARELVDYAFLVGLSEIRSSGRT